MAARSPSSLLPFSAPRSPSDILSILTPSASKSWHSGREETVPAMPNACSLLGNRRVGYYPDVSTLQAGMHVGFQGGGCNRIQCPGRIQVPYHKPDSALTSPVVTFSILHSPGRRHSIDVGEHTMIAGPSISASPPLSRFQEPFIVCAVA